MAPGTKQLLDVSCPVLLPDFSVGGGGGNHGTSQLKTVSVFPLSGPLQARAWRRQKGPTRPDTFSEKAQEISTGSRGTKTQAPGLAACSQQLLSGAKKYRDSALSPRLQGLDNNSHCMIPILHPLDHQKYGEGLPVAAGTLRPNTAGRRQAAKPKWLTTVASWNCH